MEEWSQEQTRNLIGRMFGQLIALEQAVLLLVRSNPERERIASVLDGTLDAMVDNIMALPIEETALEALREMRKKLIDAAE